MTILDLRHGSATERSRELAALFSIENAWLSAVGPQAASGATNRMVGAMLLDKKVQVFGHSTGTGIDAAAAVRASEWDSGHFGFAIQRLHGFTVARGIARPDATATALVRDGLLPRIAAAEMTMARVSLDAIAELNALESAGFRTMDVQVTWMRRGPVANSISARAAIRSATPKDVAALSVIARESMREAPTHFHVDGRFDAERVDALYERWAENSVTGAAAEFVAIAEIGNEIAGFTTAKVVGLGDAAAERYGVLPLVAVAARYRGLGVAHGLICAALTWFDGQGVTSVCVGTQANNFPAARLYAKLGFRPVHAAASLHRWRDSGHLA